jgi:hypothetical protein
VSAPVRAACAPPSSAGRSSRRARNPPRAVTARACSGLRLRLLIPRAAHCVFRLCAIRVRPLLQRRLSSAHGAEEEGVGALCSQCWMSNCERIKTIAAHREPTAKLRLPPSCISEEERGESRSCPSQPVLKASESDFRRRSHCTQRVGGLLW